VLPSTPPPAFFDLLLFFAVLLEYLFYTVGQIFYFVQFVRRYRVGGVIKRLDFKEYAFLVLLSSVRGSSEKYADRRSRRRLYSQ
jgi:predicted membrane channel-forming protein YqfA (hemolysin III family)